ncbi:TIGR03943 family protein [Streptomyces sp. LP05-1]|uniref:TIGR03943 family protein n=1 Tax=Streptomyces pyxinae TaxID=2970734 RepID=A0ABT2CPU5_9ACTN|nr:TIGR03943 family protein [Streptomyces sp. LP05-1]MCS0638569.1 TIGR03943 family protein [Streptomyces sp. LP05-1]
MRRPVQAVLLLLAGAAVLHISLLTELWLRYVKEGLRPYLIASGLVLVALGVLGAIRDGLPFFEGLGSSPGASEADAGGRPDSPARSSRAARALPGGSEEQGHEHGDSHEHSHGHDHRHGPGVAWLLFLPVVALLVYAPPALGAYTAARGNDKPVAAVAAFDPLPAGEPVPLSLSQFIARVQQDESRAVARRTVLLTGFVTPAGGGDWYVTRLVVSCCAADSQTLRVRVHGVPAPPADSWVRVTGTWHPDGTLGTAGAVAGLDARAVRPTAPPVNPYWDNVPAL